MEKTLSRRARRLAAARQAIDRALDEALDDLSELVEHITGRRGDGRLVVFRVRSAGDAYALHRVDLAHDGEVTTLYPHGPDLATWTELYGDLREAVARWAAATCPEGLAVLLRGHPASITAYPPEHCGHWDGNPDLAVDYPAPLPDAPPADLPQPRCCAVHRVEHALDRHGLQPPSIRIHHDCDDE
jgi:hypothetical protein